MRILLWIVLSVVALIVVLFVVAVILDFVERLKARKEERNLARDPDFIRRMGRDKQIEELIGLADKAASRKIRAEALEALTELQDPRSLTPLLRICFEGRTPPEVRAAAGKALIGMPGDLLVPLLLGKLSGPRKAAAIDILRNFDLPKARAAVKKFDAEQKRAEALRERRRKIVDELLTKTGKDDGASVFVHLDTQLGGGTVAGKIVGGLLTGGVAAVTPNRLSLDHTVKLPEMCAWCGCFPGVHTRQAGCSFRFASAAWSLTGVNTSGEANLSYKVCIDCGPVDQKTAAMRISMDRNEKGVWVAELRVLNPAVARQIRELNGLIAADKASG